MACWRYGDRYEASHSPPFAFLCHGGQPARPNCQAAGHGTSSRPGVLLHDPSQRAEPMLGLIFSFPTPPLLPLMHIRVDCRCARTLTSARHSLAPFVSSPPSPPMAWCSAAWGLAALPRCNFLPQRWECGRRSGGLLETYRDSTGSAYIRA